MTCVTRAGARPLFTSCARLLPRLGVLVLAASGATGCYGHSTADEALLYDPEAEEADAGTGRDETDGGRSNNNGGSTDDDPCADIDPADIFGQIACDFTNNANTGSLGASNGQCRNPDPNDLITQGLCLVQTLTGTGSASNDPLGGALDLLNVLSLLGDLTGGGGNQGAGGLGDLLGLLGGGQQQTNTNAGGLGDLLGLLGGLQGNGTAQTQQQAPR